MLLLSLILSSCSEITKVIDPCKGEFEDCKYGCGEGWLSGACKEKCTYDYNKCNKEKGGKNAN